MILTIKELDLASDMVEKLMKSNLREIEELANENISEPDRATFITIVMLSVSRAITNAWEQAKVENKKARDTENWN